ncbi:MAG: cupin domain-containing protein [Candidatus Zixiibacteriota bacterium]|mgnify:FL=1
MSEPVRKSEFRNTAERNIKELSKRLNEYFAPKVIGEVNDVFIKVTKTKGEDVPWHTHDNEDEMFYILEGSLTMFVENEPPLTLEAGEFFIVKQGVRHRVSSRDDCWMMLIENKSTKHVGDAISHIAKSIEEQL